MDFKDSHYIKEILDFHLPRFDELPNIDLYNKYFIITKNKEVEYLSLDSDKFKIHKLK